MTTITAEAKSVLRRENVRRAAFVLLLLSPVVVIFFARWLCNRTIETELIDYRFLGATRSLPSLPYIQAEVIRAIYMLGFALCAAAALCVALFWASAAAVYGNFLKASRRRIHLGIMGAGCLLVFVWLSIDLTDFDLAKMRGVGDIPRALYQATLAKLPLCSDAHPRCVGIGSTHVNLMRAISLVFGIVGAAGFAYAYAVTLIATHISVQVEQSRKSLTNLTILAAAAFLATVVATQLVFEPPKAMIGSLLPPQAPDAPTPMVLVKYEALANAMTLYWGVNFSVALAATYFPALAYFSAAVDGSLEIASFWGVGKKVLTALAPLIGGVTFQIVSDVVSSFVG